MRDSRPTLRTLLEDDLRALAAAGHIGATGEREVLLRLDTDGNVRWFESHRVRAPASELERDATPTA